MNFCLVLQVKSLKPFSLRFKIFGVMSYLQFLFSWYCLDQFETSIPIIGIIWPPMGYISTHETFLHL